MYRRPRQPEELNQKGCKRKGGKKLMEVYTSPNIAFQRAIVGFPSSPLED